MDASGSMFAGERWKQAEEAVKLLAPHACRCDPDGISLYFFSSLFYKYEHVKTAKQVNAFFAQRVNQIRGNIA